jgi:hypothetical protein
MIRPFNLRDLALVHRLGERGTMLQTQAALTTIPHPVRRALAHMLVGGPYMTYVWKSDQGNAAAFAQLCWREGDASAYIIGIGVTPSTKVSDQIDAHYEESWLKLLDELIKEAGRLKVHNVVAEANEDGPELDILRKAGFVVYTRQDIWIADEVAEGKRSISLQPSRSVDDWDINILYSNSIPGLLHSIEPSPPLSFGQNWVLREKHGELAAYVHMTTGTVANWMQLFIHPNANSKPKEIIKAALDIVSPTPELPIYCCVRRYQSWLLGALENAGFRSWGCQAVLVKQIVQPVKHRTPALQDVLQAQTVPGSSPAIQGFSPLNGRNRVK